mmetsp:Transcript_7120/g.15714  ORF Transcript_7120/g.15714 Transcript_7120/m.15714 type:complete len:114 (+) Transcript_7120:593-934(+)
MFRVHLSQYEDGPDLQGVRGGDTSRIVRGYDSHYSGDEPPEDGGSWIDGGDDDGPVVVPRVRGGRRAVQWTPWLGCAAKICSESAMSETRSNCTVVKTKSGHVCYGPCQWMHF